MRFIIKQKAWSLAGGFRIFDETEQPVYQVNGKFLSIGDKLKFADMAGQVLAEIHQKLLSLKPKYEIYRNGEHFASIVKEFSWLNSRFTLDVPGPNDYQITGGFWEYEYEFLRNNVIVASVSKEFFSFTDTYGVNIIDGEDNVAILATIIVIDMICHHRQK